VRPRREVADDRLRQPAGGLHGLFRESPEVREQLDADRGVAGKAHGGEELLEGDPSSTRRQVEVAHPVSQTLGNARLAAVGLGAAQVVVEVDVADEAGLARPQWSRDPSA
jgi:hypothetical protein